MNRRAGAVLAGLAVAFGLAACNSGGSSSKASPDSDTPAKFGNLTSAEEQYGLAPHPDSHIALQPDVVMVGGGADSVKSVSDTGAVWTINASASRASELAVGKVMFLTSRGMGRVAAIEKRGTDLVVTLGPADITDVIREGRLDFDQPIDTATLATQLSPGLLSVETPHLASGPVTADTGATTTGAPGLDSSSTAHLLGPAVRVVVAPAAPMGRLLRRVLRAPFALTAATPSPGCSTTTSGAGSSAGSTETKACGVGGNGNGGGGNGNGGGGANPGKSGAAGNGRNGKGNPAKTTPTSAPKPRPDGKTTRNTEPTRSSESFTRDKAPAAGSCAAEAFQVGLTGAIVPLAKLLGLQGGQSQTSSGASGSSGGSGADAAQPKPQSSGKVKLEVGKVGVESDVTPTTLRLWIRSNTKLKLGLQMCFDVDRLHIRSSLNIHGGKVESGEFKLQGVKGVVVSLAAGSENGLSDNYKVKAELPYELQSQEISAAGIPYVVSVKLALLVDTAFSAKNSTIQGFAQYGLEGDLGASYTGTGGAIAETPKFSVVRPMLDTLGGLSVGVNGIVLAVKVQTQIGLGVTAFNAGPFGAITVAVGATVGSDLGIVKCRGVTVSIDAKAGVGFEIAPVAEKLLKFLPNVKLKTEYAPLAVNIMSRGAVRPRVPICGG